MEREAASGRAELDALRGKHEQAWAHLDVPTGSGVSTVVSGGCLRLVCWELICAACISLEQRVSDSLPASRREKNHSLMAALQYICPQTRAAAASCLPRRMTCDSMKDTPTSASEPCGAAAACAGPAAAWAAGGGGRPAHAERPRARRVRQVDCGKSGSCCDRHAPPIRGFASHTVMHWPSAERVIVRSIEAAPPGLEACIPAGARAMPAFQGVMRRCPERRSSALWAA